MKDTPAAARVWAKTGSMSKVRSLSGYVLTLDGEPLVFSFMVTASACPRHASTRRWTKRCVRLVKFPRELHEE